MKATTRKGCQEDPPIKRWLDIAEIHDMEKNHLTIQQFTNQIQLKPLHIDWDTFSCFTKLYAPVTPFCFCSVIIKGKVIKLLFFLSVNFYLIGD